jgi:hypothetical protein
LAFQVVQPKDLDDVLDVLGCSAGLHDCDHGLLLENLVLDEQTKERPRWGPLLMT